MTPKQQDAVRTLAEQFRDAAAQELEAAPTRAMQHHLVQEIVAMDTWLMLDKARRNSGPRDC